MKTGKFRLGSAWYGRGVQLMASAMLVVGCGAGSESEEGSDTTSAALSSQGSITIDQWNNVTGNTVSAIPLTTAPSTTGVLTNFEIPVNSRDNYGVRVRGFVVPPTSGSYTFWIASDDASELYLSTSANETNKVRIAYSTQWTNSREWNKFTTQRSQPVTLSAGQRYYIEALMKEGNGGDNLAVGWLKPGQSGSVPSEVIPGAQLAAYEPPSTSATYQAELATIGNGIVETLHGGYTGTGYANTNNVVGSYVEWHVNAPQAGSAQLSFRYSSINSRTAQFSVNGSVINPSLPFPTTSSWEAWSAVTVNVTLRAGNNDIRLTGTTAESCPNLDKLDVTLGSTPPLDSDGDRLPDSVETNTGTYKSASDTGTDPNNPDSDGDGINDGDEVLGTTGGLNLPAMGTSPVHKNILLEHDWFNDSKECSQHSHRPSAASITELAQAFARAPVSNPDRTTGIVVISDYGQGGLFTGGTLVADADGVLSGDVTGSEYQNYKAANLAPNRQGYFHYTLHVHNYNLTSGSSGNAEIFGDDLAVSLQCNFDYLPYVRNTMMHELGHNLGLYHGGFEDLNDKPNYNSVMNYSYQFSGVDTTCDRVGDGPANYSSGKYVRLDENSLDERAGVCGNVAIDWNLSSSIQTNVRYDVNRDGFYNVLLDYDDWTNLYYAGPVPPGPFARRTISVATCPPAPAH